MPDLNAGVPGAQPGTGQNPDEVSSQNKSVQTDDPNAREGAKPQDKPTEDPSAKDLEGDKASDKEDDKQIPFHKNPAFQRQQRKISQQGARLEEQSAMIEKLLGLVESEAAARKGEEYKPEKKPTTLPSPEDILDSEMNKLSSTVDLSPEEEVEIEEIAKKYAYDVDGTKVYLPASSAYQIFKDQIAAGNPDAAPKVDADGKPVTPSTRPSGSSGGEAAVGKIQLSKPGEKLTTDQIFARARQVLASREE